MSDLANIIKNATPPVELTQSQYNSLSAQQKNNDIVYYITNGTTIEQSASVLTTQNSNVQTELNTLNTNIDNIISGQQVANTVQYLYAPYTGGIHTDKYGNFIHNSTTNTNYWNITSYEGRYPLRVYFQTGRITGLNNHPIVYGKGDTVSLVYFGTAILTGSGTRLNISIPLQHAASSISLTRLHGFTVINNVGNYAYMKYRNGNADAFISLSNRQVWTNSAEAYSNSISNISVTSFASSVRILIDFTSRLTTNNSGSTNVVNNTPIGFYGNFTLAFS